jgi:DNA-binding NtrC family response regulator
MPLGPLPASFRVLIVDDDAAYAGLIETRLREAGHAVEIARSGAAALARVRKDPFDVLLVDLATPGFDALDLLPRLDPIDGPQVIVTSGAISLRSAVEVMKLGAFDCIAKTDPPESTAALVHKAGTQRRRRHAEPATRGRGAANVPVPEFIARSPRMREILEVLPDVAASNVSILLTGESGTGKDVIARQIHRLSNRASGPFVDVNCAALPESLLEAELFGYERGAFTGAMALTPGLAEAAEGGTLFLDEVAEMPPGLQAKLLRMTEDRTLYRVGGRQRIRLDIRIVAATNRNLKEEIARGRLRDDLYFRLAGVEITMPPLRDRPEEIEPLARHYLQIAVRQTGRGPSSIAPEALSALAEYRWPGNIRELRNLMERMALLVRSPVLKVSDLPPEVARPTGASVPLPNGTSAPSLKEIERSQIQKVLEEEGWHRERSASRLGLPLRTLYRKIRAYKLVPPHARMESESDS